MAEWLGLPAQVPYFACHRAREKGLLWDGYTILPSRMWTERPAYAAASGSWVIIRMV